MYLVWKFVIFGFVWCSFFFFFPSQSWLLIIYYSERDLGLIQREGAQNYGAIIFKFSVLSL